MNAEWMGVDPLNRKMATSSFHPTCAKSEAGLLTSTIDRSMAITHMRTMILLTCALLGAAFHCDAATDPSPFPFDPQQLSGWWAESYDTDVTCGPRNLRVAMQIDAVAKRLEMRFDRKWKTELGELERAGAKILFATGRTLVIRYDNETRKGSNGEPVEWELAVVAPGVYRWRETDWPPGEVNIVVGVRCSE